MGTFLRSSLFALLFIACNIFSFTRSDTVFLNPSGNLTVCPNEIATFTCKTWGGALVWVTSGDNTEQVFNVATQASSDLGIFRLSVNGVQINDMMVVDVNSTARTIVGFRLEDDSTTLSCLVGSDFTRKDAVLRVADPPQAPVVAPITQLTQNGINNSSILISWNASDCAVQYVVTINSSDDSVYYNITTDTNTTVKLSNGVEFCVTVVAVDGIGRKGPDSIPLCHEILPTPSTSIVDVSTSVNQSPYAVSTSSLALKHTDTTETGTLSPTKSPVVMGGVSPVAIVVPIVVILILVVLVVIVIAVPLFLRRQRRKGTKDPDLQSQSSISETAVIPIAMQDRHMQDDQNAASSAGRECICQVFYQQLPDVLNNWKFIFAIVPKEHLSAVDQFNEMKVYGDSHIVQLNSDTIDNVSIDISNTSNGWNVQNELSVSRTAVEQYNGEGVPPHCEMIVKAAAEDVTLSDLSFTASFNGLQKPLVILIDRHFHSPKIVEYFAQVFYQQLSGLNNWKFIFTIVPKEHLSAMDQFNEMKVYGDSHNVQLNSDTIDSVSINISNTSDGWNVQNELSVSRTAVEQYNGEGVPPHCETIVKAAAEGVTPSDLSFTASFNGLQNPLVVSIDKHFQAQNVVKCITQVFYYPLNKTNINCWKAKIAFFPRKQRKHVVKRIFQDSNICPIRNKLNFCGGTISVVADDTTCNGWTVTKSDQHKEVNTAVMERYNGDGEPPYCELILQAVSDDSTPRDLSLTITLTGVKQPSDIFTLTRVFVTPKGVPRALAVTNKSIANTTYVCQVFYHRMGINHWKATLTFSPKDKIDRVREFYQDANIDRTTTDVVFAFLTSSLMPSFLASTIKTDPIDTKLNSKKGWNVYSTGREITRSDVVQYTGADWPPFIEIIIEPASTETAPSADLKQDVILTGVTEPKKIVIERASDMTADDVDNTSQSSNDSFEDVPLETTL